MRIPSAAQVVGSAEGMLYLLDHAFSGLAWIWVLGDRTAHDNVVSAQLNSSFGGSDTLLIARLGSGAAYPGGDDQKLDPASFLDLGSIFRGGDHAVKSSRFRLVGKVEGELCCSGEA